MKNNFFFCFIFVLLTGCSKNHEEANIIQQNDEITLSFLNAPAVKDSIKIGANDFLVLDTPFISYNTRDNYLYKVLELKNSNKFKVKEDTIYLRLRYDFDKFESYIFYRGDSVLIDYINEKPMPKVLNRIPKEYNYKLSQVLNNLYKPLNEISFIKTNHRLRNRNEENIYKNEINNYHSKSSQILDSLRENNLLSNDVFQFKKKEIFYSAHHSQKQIISVIKDSKDLHIDTYKGMLLKFAKNLVNPKTISSANGYIFNSKKGFDLVAESNLFDNQSKEFLLWIFLKEISNNFSKNDFNIKYEIFAQKVNNKMLIQNIGDQFLIGYSDIEDKTEDVFLINKHRKQTSLNEIIKKHQGKVVFIDFWASWCMPCRKVIPDSKKLISEYKDENVVFIFMSIDNSLKDWQDAQKHENLDSYEDSYLIINYPNAAFFRKINLKYIPRYILFDKKGDLVYQNVPGPSSDNIRDILDEHISK